MNITKLQAAAVRCELYNEKYEIVMRWYLHPWGLKLEGFDYTSDKITRESKIISWEEIKDYNGSHNSLLELHEERILNKLLSLRDNPER